MAIVRTYLCGDCGTKFDKLHFDRSEPPPECPGCQAIAAKQVQVPAGFAIKGNISKAVDMTQSIMENDLGFTDFKDSVREGEIAVKTPAHLEAAVAGMWKPSGAIIAAAKAGAAAAAAEGRNPLTLMQRASKAAYGGAKHHVPINPVNRVR